MKQLTRAMAVGVVAVLAGAGCGVLPGGGGDTYDVTVYFPRAVALYKQGQVRVLGLPAGRVQSVETDGNRVRVELSINDDIPLPADVHAVIVPQSLIGERYVQLMPAWRAGQPRAKDGHVIDIADTIIPVEPDEALAALDEFINALDPDGLGRLVDNLSEALDGNGASLNRALDNVGDLVETLASKDDELVSIVESFDRFTQTLRTREQQLGVVLDAFSAATQVLADERESLERLVASLASLAENGLDLVADNATELRGNIATLARLAQSIVVNLDAVAQLLDSAPVLTSGLLGAYNEEARAMDLRNNFGPLLSSLLDPILQSILGPGFHLPCLPILQACSGSVIGLSDSDALPADLDSAAPPATDPVGAVLALVASPMVTPAADPAPSVASRISGSAGAAGRFLGGAAASLVGVGG